MGERVAQIAKVHEVKQSNSSSRVRRTKRLQSMDTPVDRILYLQRTAGNQAVSRLMKSGALQAKLRIGQPGDVYEQEADRVADAVMRMPKPGVQRQIGPEEEEEETLQSKPLANQITPFVRVQRQEEPEEEEETLQAKPLAGQITPLVQRQVEPEEEEEELQAKATSGRISEVTPNLESHILSLKDGGQPLSESARAHFEPRFGCDFSRVRVHTDTRAAESARAMNARAYTVGQDVVFRAGQYAPESSTGQRLMAHELTHVVQQNDRSNVRQRRASTSFTRLSEPAIQLTPKGGWNETSARLECKGQIAKWRAAKYNFAANLLQYFLSKGGPTDYPHSSADLDEIKKHSAPKICEEIAEIVDQEVRRGPSFQPHFVFKHGPGDLTVTISHAGKGSSKSSNIRWLFIISDKNMLYAYGGADLNVKGKATIKEKRKWQIFKIRTWKGKFDIALGDEYTYDSKSSAKTWVSSVYRDAYAAALWLERSRHGYKSFYHNAKFKMTCSR